MSPCHTGCRWTHQHHATWQAGVSCSIGLCMGKAGTAVRLSSLCTPIYRGIKEAVRSDKAHYFFALILQRSHREMLFSCNR